MAKVEWSAGIDSVSGALSKPGKNGQDQMAFIAQKDLAGGKKTLKAWYWMVEGAAYDQEHPRN